MLYPVLQDPLRPVVGSLFDRPRGASIGQMLFGAGEQGGWYDVADLSTLFQDSAGATPVTAVEQQVGRILDKSGRGNHATQVTATKRPVYSRRVNLLTKTEQFDDAVWLPKNITLTLGQSGIPDIAPVAVRITPTATSGAHGFAAFFVAARNSTTHSVYVKADGYSKVGFKESSTSGWFAAFDLNSVTVLSSTPGSLPTIQALAGGWCRISFSPVTTNAGQSFDVRVLPNSYVSGDTNAAGFAGDGVSGVLMCGPQMEDGLTATPYQRVTTAADYDADPAKFPAYLRFDGVDDALQTGNIDFTSTDKMAVWAGVDKVTGSATGVIVESSGSFSSNNGAFALLGHSTLGFEFASRGTALSDTTFNPSPPASPSIVTASFDIGGGSVVRRVNSQQSAITANQGTGQYGNYPVYIGGRSAASLFFNGRLYSLIVRGAQTPLSQIEATELYIKQKMRMP